MKGRKEWMLASTYGISTVAATREEHGGAMDTIRIVPYTCSRRLHAATVRASDRGRFFQHRESLETMAILRKLPAAVAVAALTALLAGCGSSDVRDERDEARMERDAAQAAAEAAAAEAAAAEAARMEAEAAAEQAEMDAAAAVEQAEMDAAAAVEQAEMDAAAAVEQAEMEAAAAEEARMAAEAERDRLAQEEADRQAAAQTAADREMVSTSRALYQTLDEKMQLVMHAPGAAAAVGDITATNKSISWLEADPDGTVGNTDDVTTALRASGAESTTMGEWTGMEYNREVTRATRATRDTAMVYTNQGAPTVTGKLFVVEHGDLLDTTKTSVGDAALDGTTPPTGYTADQIRMYIAGPEFAASSGTKGHANNTGGGVGSLHTSFETRGTFDGAPGTYRCVPDATTSPCTSAVQGGTSANQIQLAGGTWTFTPDVGAMTARSTPDPDYFVYGWWLRNSDEKGYEVGTFTDVVDADPAIAVLGITTLEGSATYMGHAAGKYALLPGLDNPTGDVGHFTANVMLTADWGDEAAIGTLSGMVDGFMGADGMARDWTVELQKTTLRATGETDSGLTSTDSVEMMQTVWTIGDAADAAGGWMGTLHEASPASSPRAGTPTTALGEFTAEHGVVGEADSAFGHMAGAFGATLQ